MSLRFDAVLFDLDETLWHFDDTPEIKQVAAAFAPRIEAVVHGWGQQSRIGYAELDIALLGAQVDAIHASEATDCREPDLDAVFVHELGRIGVTATPQQARELRIAMWPDPAILRPSLFDGVVEMLRALRGNGTKLAAVTNRSIGGAVLGRELIHHGIESFFDVVLTAGDVGWRKPHPAMVEKALADLGMGSEQAVVVGDSLVDDIQAAKAAGVASVLVRRPGRVIRRPDGLSHTPDYEVDSLRQLVGILG